MNEKEKKAIDSDDSESQSAEFVCVFQGIDRVEPFLLRDKLIQCGLIAEARGFDLTGAVGELPADTMTVWVPLHQANRAKELIEEFIRPQAPVATWSCVSCGEDNPGEFGSCWNCGKDSPNLP